MMNSQKSARHTIWKYFVLLPVLTRIGMRAQQTRGARSDHNALNSRYHRSTGKSDGHSNGVRQRNCYRPGHPGVICNRLNRRRLKPLRRNYRESILRPGHHEPSPIRPSRVSAATMTTSHFE